MNRTFPAHPPTPTHQIRPEDEGRIRDIAEAEEQAYARPFQAGDFVRVTGWDGVGQVTSVDDEYVWVSLKDQHVRTGWRPANGYLPADVKHVFDGRVHDVAEAELLAYAEDAEPEGEPADISEDDTFDPPTSGRPLEPGHRIVITLHASRQRHLADVTFVGERYTEYVRQDGVRGRIGLDREGWAFGDDRVQIWDGDDDGADDGVHRASSQAGLAAVRMSLPAVVQMDVAEAKAEGRVLRLALEWEEMRSTLHTVQDVITASEKVIAKTDELIAAIRDYRQAVA